MIAQPEFNDRPVAVLFSGGIDSFLLVHQLLKRGNRVVPIYFRSGLLWQKDELLAAVRCLRAIARPQLERLVTIDVPARSLYGNHWSCTGIDVPDDSSPHEAVELPGWNALLTMHASLWCQINGIDTLAIGTLKGNPFADATPDYFAHIAAALAISSPGVETPVSVIQPLVRLEKSQALQLGRNVPLEQTFSCLAPQQGLHCGRCNKCAERQRAFEAVARPDLTRYVEHMCVH